jgi:transposase
MKGLLAGVGIRMALAGEVEAQLEQVCQWDGAPLPVALRAHLQRAWQQACVLTQQSMTLEAERREVLRTCEEPVLDQVRQFATLRGIGSNSAWLCVMAFFAWRHLQTPKQVGALAGLTPTPYQSGEASRELGMTKAGHGYMRTMAVEIAWGWIRFQPQSALPHFSVGMEQCRRHRLAALASSFFRNQPHRLQELPTRLRATQ